MKRTYELNNYFPMAEMPRNRLMINPEQSANFSKTFPLFIKGNYFLFRNISPLKMFFSRLKTKGSCPAPFFSMKSIMKFLGHYLQIFREIMSSVAIYMMSNLVGFEPPTQFFFQNQVGIFYISLSICPTMRGKFNKIVALRTNYEFLWDNKISHNGKIIT